MKNQALFSSKDKSKKLKCCLLQFLFGNLRVNVRPFSFRLLSIRIAKNCNLPVINIVDTDMWVMINTVDNSIVTLKCLSIGTPKTINFPFVSNGKLIVFMCPNIQAHYNEAIVYLNIGTPKNNEFSIWNKWKIYYF